MMNGIFENALIESLANTFPRSQLQCNRLQESDAELIRLPGTNALLAITTDSIVEEIEIGLYTDPYLIGWMTVMVNASDLAAVGAEPIGILLNETLPHDAGGDFIASLQNGIHDACSVCSIHVLGGDTNFSSRLQMGGCALGFVSDGLPMTRLGCKPGDHLFASNRLGLGNGYALIQTEAGSIRKQVSFQYQPQARLREGQLLRNFASCCMDTSDGALPTLDQLMRLNEVGFVLESHLEEFIHPHALHLSKVAGIPAWLMLAGPHGEFELLFTVPSQQVEALLVTASAQGWKPIYLGKVVEEPEIKLRLHEELTTLDTGKVRNLFAEVKGDVGEYIKGLIHMDATIGASGR